LDILIDGLRKTGQRFQMHENEVALFNGPGIEIDVIGFALAHRIEPLVYFFVRDSRLFIFGRQAAVFAELELRRHLENRFEANRLARLKVKIGYVGSSNNLQIVLLHFIAKSLRQKHFQDFAANLAFEARLNQAERRFAGTESGKTNTQLDGIGDSLPGKLHLFERNLNFERTLAIDGCRHGFYVDGRGAELASPRLNVLGISS